MNLLDYLIPFALALGLLIAFHELGHFLVARWCGVKVLRFSVGFGKPLLARRFGADQTEWVLAAFPLGGYVKMLDEREADVDPVEVHRAFNRQSLGKRFAIVAAGPLANLLLAVALYWGLFVVGSEELRPRIDRPVAESAAAAAGLQAGDSIVGVEGETIRSWQELRWAMLTHALDGARIRLVIESGDTALRSERSLSLEATSLEADAGDVLRQIGLKPLRPSIPAVIGRVLEGSAASRAGIAAGDTVVAIDGQPVQTWEALVETVIGSDGRVLNFSLARDGVRLEIPVVPDLKKVKGREVPMIGVAAQDSPELRAQLFTTVSYGVPEAFFKAWRQTWETCVLIIGSIRKMIVGEVSLKNLSGPVTIADFAGQSAQLGLPYYLNFLAMISISLGILNLLPIPVLDGGHLLYYSIEFIKGSPVSERVMEIGQQVGLGLLVMLMALAFYNDITRLISG